MSQQMRSASTGAYDPSAAQCLIDKTRNGIRTFESAKRRTATDKQCIDMGPRPAFFQVGHNRLTYFSG
jgi:hypothetical protein